MVKYVWYDVEILDDLWYTTKKFRVRAICNYRLDKRE